MKTKVVLFLIIWVLSLNGPAVYGDAPSTLKGVNNFYVRIKDLDPGAVRLGLSKRNLKNLILSKLRREGLTIAKEKTPPNIHCFYIYLIVKGKDFQINLNICKYLPPVGCSGIIWSTTVTGQHRNNPGIIMSSLSSCIDEFLSDYERENPRS